MMRGMPAWKFELDRTSGTTKQTQIREYFVKSILNRSMVPGDALPSTRQLSDHLGVSRNTIILAYQALTDSGYIEPLSRSGFVVSQDAPVSQLQEEGESTKGTRPGLVGRKIRSHATTNQHCPQTAELA